MCKQKYIKTAGKLYLIPVKGQVCFRRNLNLGAGCMALLWHFVGCLKWRSWWFCSSVLVLARNRYWGTNSTMAMWRQRERYCKVFQKHSKTRISFIDSSTIGYLWLFSQVIIHWQFPVSSSGAVVLRLAKSWFRIGSLEILSRTGETDLLRLDWSLLSDSNIRWVTVSLHLRRWLPAAFLLWSVTPVYCPVALRKLLNFVIEEHFPSISSDDPDKYLVSHDKIT